MRVNSGSQHSDLIHCSMHSLEKLPHLLLAFQNKISYRSCRLQKLHSIENLLDNLFRAVSNIVETVAGLEKEIHNLKEKIKNTKKMVKENGDSVDFNDEKIPNLKRDLKAF